MHYSIYLPFETVLRSDQKNQMLNFEISGVFRSFFFKGNFDEIAEDVKTGLVAVGMGSRPS